MDQATLHTLFDYDDGFLIWRQSKGRARKGTRAGSTNGTGREQVRVDGKIYLTYRLIYLMHHGHLPQRLDHIDGDLSNNRIENLRECTQAQNRCNSVGKKSGSKTGVKGVHPKRGKYFVRVGHEGQLYHGGTYATIEEASAVAEKMRKELHGEYAR